MNCGGRKLDLTRPAVMGILNVTPDSFADGGVFFAPDRALAHAHTMHVQGAAIIDVGGESTRPGARPVSAQEEIDRVAPIIEVLARELPIPISVDTSKAEVMRAAIAAGAGLINDVRALREPGAIEAAAMLGVPVCLMHMQGEPTTMQREPQYADVVSDVYEFLRGRMDVAAAAGISRDNLLLDPGFGFGKTLSHNLDLLRHLRRFTDLGPPVLAGLSRKSMVGQLFGLPVAERLHPSVALATIAVQNGANMVRVHDVGPTVQALRTLRAVYPSTMEQRTT